MRTLLLLVLLVVGLAAAGVIHFQKNGDTETISVDEVKLKDLTAKAIKKGAAVVNEVEASLDKPSDNPPTTR